MKIRILPLLAILFTLAIVSRAFALSNADNPDKPEVESQGSPVEKASEPKADKAQCLSGDMLMAVNKKMVVLDNRESEMLEKESAFNAIRLRLDKQLLVIEAAKASLDESVERRTSQAQADLAHLTQMYKSMKPKQAAKIFNEMDVNFAAGFLREMKGAHAGLILSNMNTKKAYQISIALASRGAKYRTTDQTLP
ncbi:MAG: hypothetical protein COA91_09475 [Robiginitomaculum sp.]|nr:MAG: hypothetical protein COA91_09475 [Robiginitomaculum sp.]